MKFITFESLILGIRNQIRIDDNVSDKLHDIYGDDSYFVVNTNLITFTIEAIISEYNLITHDADFLWDVIFEQADVFYYDNVKYDCNIKTVWHYFEGTLNEYLC